MASITNILIGIVLIALGVWIALGKLTYSSTETPFKLGKHLGLLPMRILCGDLVDEGADARLDSGGFAASVSSRARDCSGRG